MNKREIKLTEYGISNKRFKELSGFCEQYPDWKKELATLNVLKGKTITDMPVSNKKCDPTSELALKRIALEEKCKLIEECAKRADEDLAEYIIQSVCYERPLWHLTDIQNMPCSKNSFYAKRKYFFCILNEKKKY